MDNEPQSGQQGAAITPQDIQTAEDQTIPQRPKQTHNRNKTPLQRLQYMRDYRAKQQAILQQAKGCNDTNVIQSPNLQAVSRHYKKGKASIANGFDRTALLREFEVLAKSGNDMAAIAALKAYAEYAGIGPATRADGLLTPDQAKGYHQRMLGELQARLAQGGLVRAQIVTGHESRTFEGRDAEVLAQVQDLLGGAQLQLDTSAIPTNTAQSAVNTQIDAPTFAQGNAPTT